MPALVGYNSVAGSVLLMWKRSIGSLPRNSLSMRTPFIFVHYSVYYTTSPQGDFKSSAYT